MKASRPLEPEYRAQYREYSLPFTLEEVSNAIKYIDLPRYSIVGNSGKTRELLCRGQFTSRVLQKTDDYSCNKPESISKCIPKGSGRPNPLMRNKLCITEIPLGFELPR